MLLSRRQVSRPRPPSPVRAALDAIRARREHEGASDDDAPAAEPRPTLPAVATAAELAW